MTTKWLEVSERYEGLAEVAGSKSNPVILGWLQNEGKGKSWVKDDATPWCGATMAGVFTEAGMAHVVPKEPLRAQAWLETGTPLNEPRVGCIVVFPRPPDPASGHVGLVTAFGDGWLDVRGGNQRDGAADKVCVKRFKTTGKTAPLGYRWPVELKTAADMVSESRIAAAAARQQRDAAKGTAAGSTAPTAPAVVPAPPKEAVQSTIDNLFVDISWAKTTANSLLDFVGFVGAKWPYVAGAVALYFFARMAWDSHLIKTWRTDDQNKGYST